MAASFPMAQSTPRFRPVRAPDPVYAERRTEEEAEQKQQLFAYVTLGVVVPPSPYETTRARASLAGSLAQQPMADPLTTRAGAANSLHWRQKL